MVFEHHCSTSSEVLMSTHSSVETQPTTADPARWRILGLLGIAQLMLILDVTVVALALPHIGADLGLGRAELTWVVTAYTVVFGGLMLLGGAAADLVGSRPVVLGGLALFTVASLVSGLAGNAEVLLGGRMAQGAAAAMLSPAGLSAVVRTFAGAELNRALGIWSALGGAGAALGVLVGGALTAGPGWQWVFYVNVPVGLVVLAALAGILPRQAPADREGRRLDWLSAALVTAATGSAIYGLVAAGDTGWTGAETVLPVLLAAALYAGFAVRQLRVAAPLMDLRLLARRSVTSGTFLILVATALMIAVFFLGSFYLQHAEGHGALVTGLLFLPVALATIVGAQVAGRLVGSTGSRTVAAAGLVLAALGLAVPALVSGTAAMVTGVAIGALGIGAVFVGASTTTFAQVGHHEAGIASGLLSTFHEFGAALGAAAVSSVAAASLAGNGVSGFERGFAFAAVLAVVAAGVALLVVPGRTRS
jgi:EmrB/QacA subfamily drug resistance transporter